MSIVQLVCSKLSATLISSLRPAPAEVTAA
jgi:hypothetical protein